MSPFGPVRPGATPERAATQERIPPKQTSVLPELGQDLVQCVDFDAVARNHTGEPAEDHPTLVALPDRDGIVLAVPQRRQRSVVDDRTVTHLRDTQPALLEQRVESTQRPTMSGTP